MKHSKLKEISSKRSKFSRLSLICAIPLIISIVVMVVVFFIDTIDLGVSATILGVITIVSVAISSIFDSKSTKYYKAAEDYIVLEIMEIINRHGIDTSYFEIVKADASEYVVGFHNQNVNYCLLQYEIDEEVQLMNKIAKRNIRVKLI